MNAFKHVIPCFFMSEKKMVRITRLNNTILVFLDVGMFPKGIFDENLIWAVG